MFGSVSEWFWKTVAGIAPGDGALGFDRIRLRPAVLDGVPWAKGRHDRWTDWHDRFRGQKVERCGIVRGPDGMRRADASACASGL